MTTRRHVLKVLAASPLAFAAGCAPANLPDPIAAWRSPGAGEADPRRHALAHAILAPNPHNMQPWLIDLPGTDEIILTADPSRLLPATDPPNRQIVIGCGAFLELLDLAARANGHRAEITLWPEGEPQPVLDARPVAHIKLSADAGVAKDPLFDQIAARRTNREPYDLTRPPAQADLDAIGLDAQLGPLLTYAASADPTRAAQLRDIVWRGWTQEMATPAALKESVDVMRLGKAEIAQHRDGLSMDFPMLEPMKALGLISREALLDPTSEANKQGAAMWKKMADAAPAFFWIASADNTRATQIAAGRAYARANLAATARGLSIHPWSMALQEYPEMAALYAEQQAMLNATAAAPVQMLARIGYAKPVDPAPRRGLAAHIKAAP
jgi:hypothetical protein